MSPIFRVARRSRTAWNLAKTAAQTAAIWGIALYVFPRWIVAAESAMGLPACPWQGRKWMGAILFALASMVGLWSGSTMAVLGRGTPLPTDCARTLVVRGPYAWVRNPMAMAGISQGAAVALYLGSLAVLIYALIGAAIWQYLIRPAEERDLRARFGDSYRAYCRAVRCWIPRRTPYRAGEHTSELNASEGGAISEEPDGRPPRFSDS